MKLDPRIENESLIYTPFSDAKINLNEHGLNEHGYFAGEIVAFQDLKGCVYGELIARNIYSECPYWCKFDGGVCSYSFYIPENSLKPVEKKYRPFTLKEFIHTIGDVGGCVRYRSKDDHEVFRSVITEIRETGGKVVLGHLTASFEGLLFEFEYYDNDVWKPFGVLEE